jgi:F-type H+-transporting ATPase subunit epsilon
MADLIELEVATPERLMVKEEVSEVQIRGKDGYLGILPGHAPLLSQLGCGSLSYKSGAQKHFMVVDGGFLEVLPDHVRVLADLAERAEEINVEKARADLRQAEQQLSNPSPNMDTEAALAAMDRAQARINAAEQK